MNGLSTARIRRPRLLGILAGSLAILALLALGSTPARAASDPVWVELLTEDAGAAGEYYSRLFGWEIVANKRGGQTIVHRGEPIGGITEIVDRLPENESVWLVGLAAADLEASVESAREAGARIHVEIKKARGIGRYAILEDPDGAPFVLVDPERPLDDSEAPGTFVWAELWTHDPDAAADFYSRVVGYATSDVELPGGAYRAFVVDERPRAGLVLLEDPGIESAWAPYVAVEDVDEVVDRAQELGGRLLLAPDPAIHDGAVALIEDPTGGVFFVYELPEETP